MAVRQVKSFIPADKLFPHWTAAGSVILTLIPKKFKMVETTPGNVVMDLGWMNTLLQTCPYEDRQTLTDRLEAVQYYVQETGEGLFLLEKLESFWGRPINQFVLSDMSRILNDHDEYLASKHKATYQQAYLHHLGVKRFA